MGESPLLGRRYQKESYTDEEMTALLDTLSRSTAPTAIRNKALIATMWQGGLRLNEALSMSPSDFDTSQPEIHVRFGKAGKDGRPRERRVRPGPYAVASVREWKATRTELGLPDRGTLFCTLDGRKMYQTYVRAMLNRVAKKARWSKRIHPHGLRHTFAVTLARAGVPAAIIQRQLGHSSLATTTIYLQTLTSEDIAEAMNKVWN